MRSQRSLRAPKEDPYCIYPGYLLTNIINVVRDSPTGTDVDLSSLESFTWSQSNKIKTLIYNPSTLVLSFIRVMFSKTPTLLFKGGIDPVFFFSGVLISIF